MDKMPNTPSDWYIKGAAYDYSDFLCSEHVLTPSLDRARSPLTTPDTCSGMRSELPRAHLWLFTDTYSGQKLWNLFSSPIV